MARGMCFPELGSIFQISIGNLRFEAVLHSRRGAVMVGVQ